MSGLKKLGWRAGGAAAGAAARADRGPRAVVGVEVLAVGAVVEAVCGS